MKKLTLLLAILVLTLSLFSCTSNQIENINNTESETETEEIVDNTIINTFVLSGPTGMGAAKLIESNDNGSSLNKYNFTIATAPDTLTAALINGEADIATIPTNLASVLYNKTNGKIKVLALNTAGVLYIVENGNSIQSLEDLKGKTIYSSGQGAVPEYALNYILEKNGLLGQVDVVFLSEHSEVATTIASNESAIGVLPEPMVTATSIQNSNVRVAIDLTEEWNKISEDGSSLVMGCVVVRTEFLEKHKKLVDNFLKEYEESIGFVNNNIENASEIIEHYGIIAKAAIAKKCIPNCNIIYIDGQEMKTILNGFLNVLYNNNPASVGGKLPDDNLYY